MSVWAVQFSCLDKSMVGIHVYTAAKNSSFSKPPQKML